MSYPTKADIKRQNAECYAQLLEEYKGLCPRLKDVFFATCTDEWIVQINGEDEEQCGSFLESHNLIIRTALHDLDKK